jgi:hypothetical protein
MDREAVDDLKSYFDVFLEDVRSELHPVIERIVADATRGLERARARESSSLWSMAEEDPRC